MKIGAVLCLVVFFGIYFFLHYDKISNRLRREYRNITGSYERYVAIDDYAGCQAQAMVEESSDEEFSKAWRRDSKELNFDAKDVDDWMESRCSATPFMSDAELNEDFDTYFKSRANDKFTRIKPEDYDGRKEKYIKMTKYQWKFLKREFSALKDEG